MVRPLSDCATLVRRLSASVAMSLSRWTRIFRPATSRLRRSATHTRYTQREIGNLLIENRHRAGSVMLGSEESGTKASGSTFIVRRNTR